ncbi:MAG: sugar phosphate isomerase/epimerase [Planctomycetota bacterium]|nr:sugar phosphate isomerase/epimerase [Planctomycetota bacterium]
MHISDLNPSRREFCKRLVAGTAAAGLATGATGEAKAPFKLKYITASSMYGRMKLDVILPEIRRTGAEHIDIWPERHANQREQIEQMGTDKFAALLDRHQVKLGIVTRYDLGPFTLQKEMRFAKEFGASMIICGARGPHGLKASKLKAAVVEFIEKMKPHIEAAAKAGIVVGVENHANSLIESPDSIRWLAEFAPSEHIGIALAPYHLPQNPALISGLIKDLGRRLVHFYAWQHGMGCHKKLPKEQELLQLPGRGKLDFAPIVSALKGARYGGWIEVFMHPVPRGIPILPTVEEVTDQINHSRKYLAGCLEKS